MNTHYFTTPLIAHLDRPEMEEHAVERPPRWRFVWIMRTLLGMLARYLKVRLGRKATVPVKAAEIRAFLERMGGIWIKVGQVVAMRTDLFPLEFCRELSRLQDRATTFPVKRSIEIIEENLERPIHEVFDEFVERPIAAASLSQVHKARLRDTGVWVVVKVQRPYAMEYFQYDLRWLRWLVRVMNLSKAVRQMRLERMLEEIQEMMEEELDYRSEASNMRRLRGTLREHHIIVPKVHLRYSTERVLVMDYIDGVFMSDFIAVSRADPERARAWARENDIETERVARRLFQSVMRQLYEDLFFHADLHPGNIVLLKGGRLAFIDCGNCGSIDQKFASQHEQYFRAMAQHSLDKAVDLLLLTMGKLPPMDVDAFKKRVIKILDRQIARSHVPDLPYRQKSIGSSSAELNRVMAEFNIEVNWDMLKMARAFECVDQNISVLNPRFNFTREMQKYQARAISRRQAAQFQQMPDLMGQIADFAQIVLPAMIQRSLTFGGSVGKGIQIAAAIFGIIKKVLIVAFIGVVWVYLYQHHHQVVDELHDESSDLLTEVGVTELTETAPRLEPEAWILIAVVTAIVIWQITRFTKRLLRPEDPLVAQRS